MVVAFAAYVLSFSRFGRTVYSIGGNAQSALLMGLRVGRTRIAVYAISGVCSALGGLLLVLYKSSGDPLNGIGLELTAIAAVVIRRGEAGARWVLDKAARHENATFELVDLAAHPVCLSLRTDFTGFGEFTPDLHQCDALAKTLEQLIAHRRQAVPSRLEL